MRSPLFLCFILCLPTAVGRLSAQESMPTVKFETESGLVIDSAGSALHAESPCTTQVTLDEVPGGRVIVYRFTNATDTAQPLPEMRIPGVHLRAVGTERLDNWQIVQWTSPFTEETHRVHLHVLRTYPLQCYAPIIGLRADSGVVGAAVIYDLARQIEMHGNYRYNPREKQWTLYFQASTGEVLTEGGRRLEPWPLPAGESVELRIAVQVAPAYDWLRAFTAYRDHFRATFGDSRHRRSEDPIYCYSLSSGRQDDLLSEDNPQAFGPLPIHKEGWKPYAEVIRNEALPQGWERCMTWGSIGRYKEHRKYNMAWEISTGWCAAQRATENVFRAIADEITLGIWWGRAASISGGFDSGHRHAWNPDDPADNAAAFAELDPAYARGVRLIGCDGLNRAVRARHWQPAGTVIAHEIFPMLHERYPEMRWIVEAASPDYMHLWGSSFVWEKRFFQPFEFGRFLAPGVETNSILKNRDKYMIDPDCNWQYRFDELRDWGLVPGVFSDWQGREIGVLRWQDPAAWPESVAVTIGDLDVRFDGTKKWTLHRIVFDGYELCIDTPGASYGAVARIANLGFVGSGHTETGREEQVQALQIRVDGEELTEAPAADLGVETLEIAKRSRIEGLELIDRWWVRDGVIEERVNIRVVEPTSLDLLYVFMYPWTRDMTDYLAVTAAGEEMGGEFAGDKSFHLNKPLEWVALYDRNAGVGVVMDYPYTQPHSKAFVKLWDQPSPYRKHYEQVLSGTELTPGAHYTYHVRVRPFRAPAATWQARAGELLAE